MDWSQSFYRQQNDLIPVYTGDIKDYHQEKVTLIQTHHPTATSVLELGAGGGQVACATALAGYNTTMIDYVDTFTDHAHQLSRQHNIHNLTILTADFYTVELTKKFDVMTYWDGFGIGTDDQQINLLKRCASWLQSDGVILIDIYTPWYWAKANGQTRQFGDVMRRYGFDAEGCRMTDTWWHIDSPDQTMTQSLRCYSPADLRLLLRDTGLQLVDIVETGGALDHQSGQYRPHTDLDNAMSYVAKLTHTSLK